VIAMMQAFFDESGEHDRHTGRPVRLTIGGMLAPVEAWQRFDSEWGATLARVGLSALHMRTLTLADRREDLLDRFVPIIGKHVQTGLSFTTAVPAGTAELHETSFIDCLMQVSNRSATVGKVSVVFAKHPEFWGGRGQGLFDFINWGDARFGSITFDDPANVFPLQAADLVAHELRRDGRVAARLRDCGCQIFRWENGVLRLRGPWDQPAYSRD
jgi:hypothetical protein